MAAASGDSPTASSSLPIRRSSQKRPVSSALFRCGKVKRGDECSPVSVIAVNSRGGAGFSDMGISGFRARERHNRRDEVHEEAKTEPLSSVQGTGGPSEDSG